MAERFGNGRPRGSTRLLAVSQMLRSPSASVSLTFVLNTIALQDRQSGTRWGSTVRAAEPAPASPGTLPRLKVFVSHFAPSALTNGFVAISCPLSLTRSERNDRPSPTTCVILALGVAEAS